MEQDILEKLEMQEKKIDAIHISVEKTRKYFLWTMIITVVTIVLPLIAAVVLIPWMLGSYMSALSL
jgi:CHASE3 domain sensor protein